MQTIRMAAFRHATQFRGTQQRLLAVRLWVPREALTAARHFSADGSPDHVACTPNAPEIVEVDYEALRQRTPAAMELLRRAFVGPRAYGAVAVNNVPGYGKKLTEAFRAGIDLAIKDAEGRKRAAAVSNTYPGWSGEPGKETHPLQSSFLFNVKEEIENGKADPYFGKNIFPSDEFRTTFVNCGTELHATALDVLRGCDALMDELVDETSGWSREGRSLHRLGTDGPALAGRFICYDSGFTREDQLLSQRSDEAVDGAPSAGGDGLDSMQTHAMPAKSAGHAGDGLASMRTHSTPVKSAGHSGDGLASMRTHSTPVKSAGHAGDGLASMRTHSTPVKSAGHSGDGLASMRTHSTPVKSAGHSGDGFSSMRTHSTPVKSAGHSGDGLASMRTHSTPVKSAGHSGDGLASMRTHSTPVKSAGHSGDGLASMRTHSTPVKSAGHSGDGLASMRTHSTPVRSAGHSGDGLASMRTHSTPVRSAGHSGDGLASMRTHSTPVRSAGHSGDGLASMRTHSTPVRSAGPSGDGLASMRTHTTLVKSAGHSGDGLASMRTHSTPVKSAGHSGDGLASMRTHTTPVTSAGYTGGEIASTPSAPIASSGFGGYWLPWHIDSNFITILHKERYALESDASFAPEPEGAGLLAMNSIGEITKFTAKEDAIIVQMGAFAQIYAGGKLTACRHAVLNPRPPGIARFNFCNFFYVPWKTVCKPPVGLEPDAVNKGWNSMMDDSYVNITMKQSFEAFRKFMTSPEARVQFADSVHFKELSELIPLKARARDLKRASSAASSGTPVPEIVIDVLTDVRCPFSHLSQRNLERALEQLGLLESVHFHYHPVFLNPNVPKEGECLDDYLLREYGYTKEYAHSADYPLHRMGRELGINFNPHRRVVNTFDAFCLIAVADELDKQHDVVEVLARRYFEGAEDISDSSVLEEIAKDELGLPPADFWRRMMQASKRVQAEYQELAAKIGSVPHFLLRERISGNGVEAGGNRSPEAWEDLLRMVIEKSQFVGMRIPGPYGKEVMLPEAHPTSPVSMALNAQHGWAPDAWPYSDNHFSRMDESMDTVMYSEPRFVTHLDDASINKLTEVYRSVFGTVPSDFAALDLCSSWTSHYPQELLGEARVAVHGLNARELEANGQATEWHVQDLNSEASLPWETGTFDFVTLALSVQYLTDPRSVFAEMHRVLKPGGMALVAFSHRCFLEKTVQVWAEETHDGEGHAHIVTRYFQHGPQGGWKSLSTIDSSPQHGDPLWLVTAVKA